MNGPISWFARNHIAANLLLGVIVVAADSPFQTLNEMVDAIKADSWASVSKLRKKMRSGE